jgi:flagellar biosynthesis/type III secretory pathway chaperone
MVPHSPVAALAPEEALGVAQRLQTLLEQEFEALRQQELERFESLQSAKNELLQTLSQSVPPVEQLQTDPAWQAVHQLLLACRDAHRRNAVLIERKLEAIRSALQTLSLASQTSSVEVYDRLGQVARFQRGRGYQDA